MTGSTGTPSVGGNKSAGLEGVERRSGRARSAPAAARHAVNLPSMNAINVPAGLLQPPYFDQARPDFMDYGAICAVIGH